MRIAGIVAALSVTGDLTRGHPQGEAMRACLLATELAQRLGLADPARAATAPDLAARYGGDPAAVTAFWM